MQKHCIPITQSQYSNLITYQVAILVELDEVLYKKKCDILSKMKDDITPDMIKKFYEKLVDMNQFSRISLLQVDWKQLALFWNIDRIDIRDLP